MDTSYRRELTARVLSKIQDIDEKLDSQAERQEQEDHEIITKTLADGTPNGNLGMVLYERLQQVLQVLLESSVSPVTNHPTEDWCAELYKASMRWSSAIDTISQKIESPEQQWVVEAMNSLKLEDILVQALKTPNSQNKNHCMKATKQITEGWSRYTVDSITKKLAKRGASQLKQLRDEHIAEEKIRRLQSIALTDAAIELYALSDHELVSGGGGASWNVLEMHIHAWHYYSMALTFPDKQAGERLRRFLSATVEMEEVVSSHDNHILSKVKHTLDEGSKFIALQEVSKSLLLKLKELAANRGWGVFDGGRLSESNKCHAICVLVLGDTIDGVCLTPEVFTRNKKKRAYPLVQSGSTIIASVHVPHDSDAHATNEVKVSTALDVLKAVMARVDVMDDITEVYIAGDLNAPTVLVCNALQNEMIGWKMEWFSSNGISMMLGEHGETVDVVLWLRR